MRIAEDRPEHLEGVARSRRLRVKFVREVAEAGLCGASAPTPPVSEEDLARLPVAVQRYLRFMNVVGRPRSWSFRLRSTGSVRLGPGKPWMRCEAWQYDTSLDIARVFHMRLRMGGLLPVLVRDTYLRGHGRMRARVLDVVDVVDVAGGALDVGELVTYLDDALLFAPSMLLRPNVHWSHVSEAAFDVTLTDRGHTVRGRAFIDGRGALTDFSTTDRYVSDEGAMVQARWSTPIDGWKLCGDRRLPVSGSAVWHLSTATSPMPASSSATRSNSTFRLHQTPDRASTDTRPGDGIAWHAYCPSASSNYAG